MEKIVLTGGGTAGHIVPNLALIPYLSDYELHYIGTPDSMEEHMVKTLAPHVTFHALPAPKFSRKLSLKTLCVPFRLLAAKCRAKKLLGQIQPRVIFSKGGFAALPAMLAAGNIPLILHESDSSMGLANRMGAKHATTICTSFSHLAETVKNGICTGAPLRDELFRGNKKRAEAESGLSGRQNLLIMGGSLGASVVNRAVKETLDMLTSRFDVVHITGKGNAQANPAPHYYPIPFTDKIADYFAWADFCVSRGGANALFELVALAIPSLIIPLPKGISRGDQVDNAAYFESLGCVAVLEQAALEASSEALTDALEQLTARHQLLKSACRSAPSVNGTAKIAKLIIDTANKIS